MGHILGYNLSLKQQFTILVYVFELSLTLHLICKLVLLTSFISLTFFIQCFLSPDPSAAPFLYIMMSCPPSPLLFTGLRSLSWNLFRFPLLFPTSNPVPPPASPPCLLFHILTFFPIAWRHFLSSLFPRLNLGSVLISVYLLYIHLACVKSVSFHCIPSFPVPFTPFCFFLSSSCLLPLLLTPQCRRLLCSSKPLAESSRSQTGLCESKVNGWPLNIYW